MSSRATALAYEAELLEEISGLRRRIASPPTTAEVALSGTEHLLLIIGLARDTVVEIADAMLYLPSEMIRRPAFQGLLDLGLTLDTDRPIAVIDERTLKEWWEHRAGASEDDILEQQEEERRYDMRREEAAA
ncbi:MAG: hypothetical protein AAFR16_01140 [Pseudomonadota bacterium]